jgi:hypothetical protein
MLFLSDGLRDAIAYWYPAVVDGHQLDATRHFRKFLLHFLLRLFVPTCLTLQLCTTMQLQILLVHALGELLDQRLLTLLLGNLALLGDVGEFGGVLAFHLFTLLLTKLTDGTHAFDFGLLGLFQLLTLFL